MRASLAARISGTSKQPDKPRILVPWAIYLHIFATTSWVASLSFIINYCEYEQGRPPMPEIHFRAFPFCHSLHCMSTQCRSEDTKESEIFVDHRRSPADRVVFLACWGLRPTCCYVAHSSGILRGFLVLWSTLGHTPGWRWTHGRSPPSKPTLNRRSTTGSVKKTSFLLKLRVNILKPLLSIFLFFCFPLD